MRSWNFYLSGFVDVSRVQVFYDRVTIDRYDLLKGRSLNLKKVYKWIFYLFISIL